MTLADLSLFSILINFITMICFFLMGGNVGAIKREIRAELAPKKVTPINYLAPYFTGELKEYLDKNEEALDCYKESYYLLQKFIQKHGDGALEKQNREAIKAKITMLGGTPKELISQ